MAPPRPFAIRALAFAAPILLLVHAATVTERNDRTITQVVKLLQGMLDSSQATGRTERDLYAKFKCFIDTNEAAKKESIEQLTKEIELLENDIEKLLAQTGMDSKKLAEVKQEIAATKEARGVANATRDRERLAWEALEADLDTAIDQMKRAIEALSAISADQSIGKSAQDHVQEMADFASAGDVSSPLAMPNLVELRNTVKKAVVAATALASSSQSATLQSFVQGPAFTGAYSAQSGEVVGILKQMRTTFKANLKEAREAEAKAVAAHLEYLRVTLDRLIELAEQETKLSNSIGSNDQSLSTKRNQLQQAKQNKEDDETYLRLLLEEAARKKKQYAERTELRAKEETAIAEAISILNSDAAFTTFGTVAATKTGATSLVQLATIHQHEPADDSRHEVQRLLRGAAKGQHAPMLGRIAAMLQADNPFDVVLQEIKKMIDLIDQEGEADIKHKGWCDSERTDTNNAIDTATTNINALNTRINTLDNDINGEDGLKKQIETTENDLQTLRDNAAEASKTRKEENADYQKDIANLVDAQALLKRAIVVLRNYYSKIDASISANLLQRSTATPAPPAFTKTWDDKYVGESAQGGSAINMLEFILTNTKAEETTAHETELAAQHSYEDAMKTFRDDEQSKVTSLGTLRADLAVAEKNLHDARKEHKAEEKQKAALEAYLEKIKPGCDFITTNIDTRTANRATEKGALQQAETKIKESPVYTEAVAKAHDESLGDCLGICKEDGEDNASCKACLRKVTVPAYCAGNPTTAGCPQ